MNVIEFSVDNLFENNEMSEAIDKLGRNKANSILAKIYNNSKNVELISNMLDDDFKEMATDWTVLIYDGTLYAEHMKELSMPELPEGIAYTNMVGNTPVVNINVSALLDVKESAREYALTFSLLKESVHREQYLRGDLYNEGDDLVWRGEIWTEGRVFEATTSAIASVLTENPELDEYTISLIASSSIPFMREATARTVAMILHKYEGELHPELLQLAKDWRADFLLELDELLLPAVDCMEQSERSDEDKLKDNFLCFGPETPRKHIMEWLDMLYTYIEQ